MDKEVRKFMQSLGNIPGVRFEEGTKHVKVLLDDRLVTTLPRTPSDHRWKANSLSVLRKAGITPSTKANAQVTVTPAMTMEDLRARLNELRSANALTAFVRFALREVAPMLGMEPPYLSERSATSSLYQFADGSTKTVKDEAFLLLTESLRMWNGRQRSVARAEKHTAPPLASPQAATEPESDSLAQIAQQVAKNLNGKHAPSGVEILLDLEALNAVLGRIGVRITIEGGKQ